MKSGRGHQEEEEEEDEDFGGKKYATPSNNNTKDGKDSDKANAMRSKHSVTEQRRRSKINERFQRLRELIPHSDQKRDTASFLLEVIQYVQCLHEKVQKYEGSYQTWSSEPTKLMPWQSNSHWCVQNISDQPQTTKNGSGPGSTFPDRFDSNSVTMSTPVQPGQQNPIEFDPIRDASYRSIDPQAGLPNKTMGVPMPLQPSMPVSITNDVAFSRSLPRQPSDAESTECQTAADGLNRQDELTIEGGTISISSVYSQGLLSSLTQALQSTGLDLSQAGISVQINLGKRACGGPSPAASIAKDHDMAVPPGNQPVRPFQDPTKSEDFDQPQKRLKI